MMNLSTAAQKFDLPTSPILCCDNPTCMFCCAGLPCASAGAPVERTTVGGEVGVVVECLAGDAARVRRIAMHLSAQMGDSLEGVAWSPEFRRAMERIGARVVSESCAPAGSEW